MVFYKGNMTRKKKRKYQYEILIDGKWHYFTCWDAVYDFSERYPEKIGRAEIILDMEEMEKEI